MGPFHHCRRLRFQGSSFPETSWAMGFLKYCWWFRKCCTNHLGWCYNPSIKSINNGISTTNLPQTGFLAGFLNHQRDIWHSVPRCAQMCPYDPQPITKTEGTWSCCAAPWHLSHWKGSSARGGHLSHTNHPWIVASLWKKRQFHGNSWDFMGFHEISRDF